MSKNFIEIKDDKLVFNYGEESFEVAFNKTLRIPDDNKEYALPPGLGYFPLAHVEDYANTLPPSWSERGGVFMPMYQAEAMWLSFTSKSGRPFAVKVATGKINAVSGEKWDNALHGKDSRTHDEPDYMVCPTQPWLDGFNVGKGVIRQFVAVPLGSGYSVEEQVTGQAEHGGVQIIVYPMKDSEWEKRRRKSRGFLRASSASLECMSMSASADMGLGAGGLMTQEIYEDKYGIDVWDMDSPLRVFVHLANSLQYKEITGKNPPTKAPTESLYRQYNYPWFSYYSDEKAIEGSKILSKIDSIASMQVKNNEKILPDEGTKPTMAPIALGKKTVSDNKW